MALDRALRDVELFPDLGVLKPRTTMPSTCFSRFESALLSRRGMSSAG